MTVKLGNIVLDEDLRLDGLESAVDISVSQSVAFDGTVDILTMPAPVKRQLSLVASAGSGGPVGIFTLAQLQSIKAVAAVGMPVTLIHHRGTFSVLIIAVSDPEYVFDHANPTLGDWYTATINMIEV